MKGSGNRSLPVHSVDLTLQGYVELVSFKLESSSPHFWLNILRISELIF